jgi:N-methylhydantoinase A
MTTSSVRAGVDIGGTFTDVVLAVGDRRFSAKVLTTYAAPEEAILDGIGQVCAPAGIAPGRIGQIIHGTTLATNALIERRGARTALVVTDGFRDVLETARGTRYDIFDLEVSAPDPLVPRARVLEADERIDRSGRVIRPLAPEQADTLAARLAALGVESVAVCLLHAYANPAHERAIGAAIAR